MDSPGGVVFIFECSAKSSCAYSLSVQLTGSGQSHRTGAILRRLSRGRAYHPAQGMEQPLTTAPNESPISLNKVLFAIKKRYFCSLFLPKIMKFICASMQILRSLPQTGKILDCRTIFFNDNTPNKKALKLQFQLVLANKKQLFLTFLDSSNNL